MGRIQRAYENRFVALLGRLKARRLDKAVAWLRSRAAAARNDAGSVNLTALAREYEAVRARLWRWHQTHPQARGGLSVPRVPARPVFWCDAGLGGLARWLRAAGFEAHWQPDIDDDHLLQSVRERPEAVLLTTDSLLMERRVLRDGLVPAVWIPPNRRAREQLVLVLRELNLKPGAPRCMSCGGELEPADKQALRERIPPRTYRWLDEYFVCQQCGKLFWQGTHWQRIRSTLDEAAANVPETKAASPKPTDDSSS